jgi:hypothetical protein
VRRFLVPLAILILCMDSVTCAAQEVVVTGLRVSGDDYSRMPAIVLERRADYLVQRIRLTNDTRAEEGRTREIYQTIRDMLADAARRTDIALGYGSEFLVPITLINHEVPLDKEPRRPDTSATELYVKMALMEKQDVQKAIAELTAFIRKARMSGRTEVELVGDVGLSLVTPEKYRYEIIGRITEDAKHLQEAVSRQCKIEVSGLSNRVSWERSDVSELTLYIPYQIKLTDCQ